MAIGRCALLAMLTFHGVEVAAQSCDGTAVFITTSGLDTIAVERMSVMGDSIHVDVSVLKQEAHLVVSGGYDANRGGVQWLWIRTSLEEGGAIIQEASVTRVDEGFRSVVIRNGKDVQVQIDSLEGTPVPFMDNLAFFLELVSRRSNELHAGSKQVELQTLSLFSGGRVADIVVTDSGRGQVFHTPVHAVYKEVSQSGEVSYTRGTSIHRMVSCER